MTVIPALFAMILGFVPYVGTVFVLMFVVWAATKLSPAFDMKMKAVFDALFGVDADYDEKYNTGY